MKKSQMTGAKDASRVFRELTKGLTVPINEASRKALKPMLSAARANAPKKTGALRKSLAIKRDPKAPKTSPTHTVGPRTDFVGPDGSVPRRYAHLTEFGRADGSMPGSRWLTRAFDSTHNDVAQRFGQEIGPAIEKRAAKLAAKRKARK